MMASPKRIIPEDREGQEQLVWLIEGKMSRADYYEIQGCEREDEVNVWQEMVLRSTRRPRR